MIDNIDLSHWSCKQLCEFHNHVIKSGTNFTDDDGYNYAYDDNDKKILLIKQTLIDIGACSKYVLEYRGQL